MAEAARLRALEARLQRALAPMDARALGLALGITAAMALVAVTVLSMAVDPTGRFPLVLLGQYYLGYAVSPSGALIGAAWAFATGFAAGWLLATARNLVIAAWLLRVRVRADLEASRDVLDQI
jgi:hypothetical protein